jgi:hypothetical protein
LEDRLQNITITLCHETLSEFTDIRNSLSLPFTSFRFLNPKPNHKDDRIPQEEDFFYSNPKLPLFLSNFGQYIRRLSFNPAAESQPDVSLFFVSMPNLRVLELLPGVISSGNPNLLKTLSSILQHYLEADRTFIVEIDTEDLQLHRDPHSSELDRQFTSLIGALACQQKLRILNSSPQLLEDLQGFLPQEEVEFVFSSVISLNGISGKVMCMELPNLEGISLYAGGVCKVKN